MKTDIVAPTQLRIGTRRSTLAIAQSEIVRAMLVRNFPDVSVEIVPLLTSGDKIPGPLAPVGGKGLFTAELEDSLRSNRIDLAVHSVKDMPACMPDDLVIAAVPPRGDARDVLISPGGWDISTLPSGAKVGTSSPRRLAQTLYHKPDACIVPLRGNVETRIAGVLDASSRRCDATLLAAAGLERIGKLDDLIVDGHASVMDVETFIPAAGQGAIAIQTLAANEKLREMLAALNHVVSAQAIEAERFVVAGLGAGCHSSVGVHVYRDGGGWRGMGMVARCDGSGLIQKSSLGIDAISAAGELLRLLVAEGATDLINVS